MKYKLLKSFYFLEKETGKLLEFLGTEISSCGKKLDDFGEDILKDLEDKGYIIKCDASDDVTNVAKKRKYKKQNSEQ